MPSLHFFGDCGRNLPHLLLGQLQFGVRDDHVALAVYRNQVDMGVRHFHAHDRHAYPLARHGCLYGGGHALGEHHQPAVCPVVEAEYIVVLHFRHDERVSFREGVYVEEGEIVIVLGHFVAGDFAVDYASEYRCHSRSE